MEQTKQNPTEKEKVLVNFDSESLDMARMMMSVREIESRSLYLRQLVKADYRKWKRKIQRLQAQS